MNKYIKILFLSLLLSVSFTVEARDLLLTSIPFENINLGGHGTLQANYSFGNHAMIFCFQSDSNISVSIQWPYKNQTKNKSIPLTLKTRAEFDGEFANASGNITLTNNTGNNVPVSCVFGF